MSEPQKSPLGKFIVYADESGDHSLQDFDERYPVFVLSFCIFHQLHYAKTIVPAIEEFKFTNFGHDIVILHERDIRRGKGDFFFPNPSDRNDFISALNDIVDSANFIVISCLIDKRNFEPEPDGDSHLYNIALRNCIEALVKFLHEKGQQLSETFVIFESRGSKEDNALELEFRRVCGGENSAREILPLQIKFAKKAVNSCGLQFADLVSRPIGVKYLNPDQGNRAYDILERKFFCRGGRERLGEDFLGYGLLHIGGK